MFRSLKHEVRMLEVSKLALSRDDDKCITVDGIASLARGHWVIRVTPRPLGTSLHNMKIFNLYT